ncbi:hypothetical protein C8R45DRAFT_1115833 [Mycena sanguinolenta]|nr:hypothetical protein C8R45DRAFT_1115833 [Mycena sanguinolenta]
MSLAIDDTPKTDEEVTDLYLKLRNMEPAFPGFKYGLLYASGTTGSRPVPIPVDHSFDQPIRLSSIDDLLTEFWVASPLPPNIVNMALGRLYIDTFPVDSSFRLEFPYTVYYTPQTVLPSNTPLNSCAPILRANLPWYGNILVVRHGKRDPVVGMTRWDYRLVDVILQSLISTGRLT